MKEYKITLGNQFKLLIIPLCCLILPLFICVYNNIDLKLALFITIGLSPLYVIPNLYLYLNHYKYLDGKSYLFKEDLIIEEKNNLQTIYKIENIEKIVLHATLAKLSNIGYHRLPYSYYYFIFIKFKDGNFIILSSILSSTIDDYLSKNYGKKLKINNKENFFPVINPSHDLQNL